MLQQIIQFLGRLHPLILHMPIGLLAGLITCELVALMRRRPLDRWVRLTFAWIVAASAAFTAASGLILSREDAYAGDALQLHQWLGIATAVLTLIAAALATRERTGSYAFALVVAMGTMVPAGHFGATLTHGADFLFEPFNPRPANGTAVQPRDTAASTSFYSTKVAPIFQARCANCHNASRRKGGLELDTPEGILAGGDSGSAIEPGDARRSEILIRLRMPLDKRDHMPPKEKGQPTPDEIATIERWITDGASFEDPPSESPAKPELPPTGQSPAAAPTHAPPPQPPADALARLAAAQVHAEAIDPVSGRLWVSFGAAPTMTDDQAVELLSPLKDFVSDLSLARTGVGEKALKLASEMPHLLRLDISGTPITSLESLKGSKSIEELRITRTKLNDDAAAIIGSISTLKRIYVWNAGLSEAAVATLHTARPELAIDSGAKPDAPLEKEPEFKFTSEAPVPGAAPVASLEAINAVCPVSGKAVDRRFRLVHDDKVVGFCCEKCLAQFLEEPEKFAVKAK